MKKHISLNFFLDVLKADQNLTKLFSEDKNNAFAVAACCSIYILGERQRLHLATVLQKSNRKVDFNHFSGVIPSYLGLEFQNARL